MCFFMFDSLLLFVLERIECLLSSNEPSNDEVVKLLDEPGLERTLVFVYTHSTIGTEEKQRDFLLLLCKLVMNAIPLSNFNGDGFELSAFGDLDGSGLSMIEMIVQLLVGCKEVVDKEPCLMNGHDVKGKTKSVLFRSVLHNI